MSSISTKYSFSIELKLLFRIWPIRLWRKTKQMLIWARCQSFIATSDLNFSSLCYFDHSSQCNPACLSDTTNANSGTFPIFTNFKRLYPKNWGLEFPYRTDCKERSNAGTMNIKECFFELQNQEDNPYDYYWISKTANKTKILPLLSNLM